VPHLDSFTYRNAFPGEQILDTFNDAERARIRAALVSYMKENSPLSVEKLYKRLSPGESGSPETLGFSFKTFQRFIAGTHRVGDEVVAVCARFVERLPGGRLETHRMADCLREFYKREPDAISGVYRVATADTPLSELTIHPPDSKRSYVVTERSTGKLARVYDGALVFTGTHSLARSCSPGPAGQTSSGIEGKHRIQAVHHVLMNAPP
jgi:hypothetical protein